jgi:hypothetical protein
MFSYTNGISLVGALRFLFGSLVFAGARMGEGRGTYRILMGRRERERETTWKTQE